ncbi:MAG: hypothetical protein EXR55_02010 [Dehalococcoidia bacterium]|nr:hypothetical protein [Dehalococcoidia bacterium]
MSEDRQQHMTQSGNPTEGSEARPYTQVQLHFLERLEQLKRLLKEYEGSSQPDAAKLQMIKKAIYSTLQDCDDQELKEEARAVLSGQAQGS